ncbi:MAG: SLBB domain-containing protein [Planctomycetota bacterium]
MIGRWERTPTTVPILSRISAIEPNNDQILDIEEIQPEDLIPESTEFAVRSGDVVIITVFDLPVRGSQTPFQRRILNTGFLELPGIGRVYADGLTVLELEQAVVQLIQDEDLVVDPQVTVEFLSAQEATYTMLGAVAAPGPYQLSRPNLRLLDAVAAAGGIDETAREIYVIRQQPLTRQATDRTGLRQRSPDAKPARQPEDGNELIDLIDDLLDSEQPSPAVFLARTGGPGTPQAHPEQPGENQPRVDLIENATAPPDGSLPAGNWVFLDGRWVRVSANGTQGLPEAGPGLTDDQLGGLVTQRVIGIPTDRLLAGDARVNIVIRAGDIIRIPPAAQGQIYMAGFVARPGAFGLARDLTLLRAVDAAGGLTGLAIPERVDLTRMIGGDRQATIRLNLRAIAEQTQPDIFLRPNDRVNVGTNFWAFPLAVARGGFRASYGFGFLLDRNFGNDVFGAPPGIGSPESQGLFTLF